MINQSPPRGKTPIPVPMTPEDQALVLNAKILYASLNEQYERRRAIERNIKSRAEYEVMACVDGRAWTDDQVNAQLSDDLRQVREKAMQDGRTWLATGAVACALTHRDHLIANCFKQGKVLCEDDALFDGEFIDLISSGDVAEQLEPLPGVTLINYRSRSHIFADKKPAARIGRYTVHRARSTGIASAAAYFVPSHVAKKIVPAQSPLKWPVDGWQAMAKDGVFDHVYLVYPSPARVGDFPSTINYGRDGHKLLDMLRNNRLLRRLRWWQLRWSGKTHSTIGSWQ